MERRTLRPRTVPAIAGRSPTYIVRQLWEFQHGNRSAGAGALMQQTDDDDQGNKPRERASKTAWVRELTASFL